MAREICAGGSLYIKRSEGGLAPRRRSFMRSLKLWGVGEPPQRRESCYSTPRPGRLAGSVVE
eukprot:scaffold1806_cov240-Pinguiococcus_pyrenoidosus.AAC.32